MRNVLRAGLLGAVCLSGGPLLAEPAIGDRDVTASATVSFEDTAAPADDAAFRERVAAMRGHIDDPDARFSASEAVRVLRLLREHAGDRADLLPERREILSMIGRMAQSSMLMEFDEGLEPLGELMRIGIGDDRPARRRFHDHYTYAKLASGHATLPKQSASHSLAADQFLLAAAIADTEPGFSEDSRAGIRQDAAYELHEARRYEEALATNREALRIGETLFGPDDPLLATVLTNLAQNLHALERRDEIEPHLLRVQRMGEAQDDLARVEDMLFQRGVLAYELGRPDEARTLMLERIARLEEAGDAVRLLSAREDYAELERRILVGQ